MERKTNRQADRGRQAGRRRRRSCLRATLGVLARATCWDSVGPPLGQEAESAKLTVALFRPAATPLV